MANENKILTKLTELVSLDNKDYNSYLYNYLSKFMQPSEVEAFKNAPFDYLIAQAMQIQYHSEDDKTQLAALELIGILIGQQYELEDY